MHNLVKLAQTIAVIRGAIMGMTCLPRAVAREVNQMQVPVNQSAHPDLQAALRDLEAKGQ